MTALYRRSISQLRVRSRAGFAALCAPLCLLLLASCGGKSDGKPEAANDAKGAAASGAKPDSGEAKPAEAGAEPASHAEVAASVETVTAATFTESVDASGTVAPRIGHFAALSAPGPTRITAVHVNLGSRVRRGDKLVSFETTAFDAAASSADAALRAAEQAEARARRLVDAGVSPRKDVELATADVAVARAASVNARRAQQLATLQSPIDGVITRLSAVLGSNVDAGQTLVELADTHTLDVQLVLSPTLASRVHPGQPVAIRDGSAADADVVASGRVADVAAALDSTTRGVMVRVSVGSQKRTLRIGESLYGRITAVTHPNALVVADDALVPTGEGFQVFVVDGEGKAHARAVTIGGRADHRVWITDGLKAGETVVTAGAFGMDDGATVVTKKSSDK